MKERIAKIVLDTLPRSLMNRLAGDFLPVFMLHSMVDYDNNPRGRGFLNLNKALEYTRKKKYKPISLDKLFISLLNGRSIPENSVCFTVDDGYVDQVNLIAPIFSKFDIPLTCFVVTDFIDKKIWLWDAQVRYIITHTRLSSFKVNLPDEQEYICIMENQIDSSRSIIGRNLINCLKEKDQTNIYRWLEQLYTAAEVINPTVPPLAYRSASWEQLKSFQKAGHWVAPHSKTHPILSQVPEESARKEIVDSFSALRKKIPDCSRVFAYPSGRDIDFSIREEKIVMESEMLGAVSAVPSHTVRQDRITCIPRYGMPNNMFDYMQYLSYIEVLKEKFRS